MLLSPRQHQILALMGVDVWQRYDAIRNTQAELPAPAPNQWSGWIRQPDSTHALVICELYAADPSAGIDFTAAEQKLLHNILFAVGMALDRSSLLLVQPGPMESRDLAIDDTTFTGLDGNAITARLPHLITGTTLVFGGRFPRWLSDTVPDALPSSACVVPFCLGEMLQQPERKAECWKIIKPLL